MFRYLSQQDTSVVSLQINQVEVTVPKGSSVWSAMAYAGETTTRLASVAEQERSAYCAMGVCFECLVEIDGMPNRQACLTEVRAGMQVKRQEITQESSLPYLTPRSTQITSDDVVQIFDCSVVSEAEGFHAK